MTHPENDLGEALAEICEAAADLIHAPGLQRRHDIGAANGSDDIQTPMTARSAAR